MRIGLTGGIGSGKSTVAAALVELGATLIDSDAISRELTAPGGAALPALRQAFGSTVIGADGGLDRAVMRTLAFAQPEIKQRLEALLHPLIGTETALRAARAKSRTLVFDVPLLVESGHWRSRVDRVLVVDCEEATQVARVMARSGWSESQVRAVIASQASRAARRAAADAVLCNEGVSLVQLQAETAALARQWQRFL